MKNRFERHPIATVLVATTALFSIALAALEIGLRVIGLGDPIIYETHSDYGYRPRPNQLVNRLGGAIIRINNLGLRANGDWDAVTDKKVLFIGDSVTYGGSYVSNSELFAIRAVSDAIGWVGGSAGVNAWGVANMYGLIVRHKFLPACVYVTVLIDADFYRGFSERAAFFRTTKPPLALFEVIPHVKESVKAYVSRNLPDLSEDAAARHWKRTRVQQAVNQLEQIDALLRSRGFVHLVYLSPSRANLEHGRYDSLVAEMLSRSSVRVRRLQDNVLLAGVDVVAIKSLYLDEVHLSPHGHEVWAALMRPDVEAAIFSVREKG